MIMIYAPPITETYNTKIDSDILKVQWKLGRDSAHFTTLY
jgi:hypothetical protein